MIKELLNWISISAAALAVLLLVVGLFLWFGSGGPIPVLEAPVTKSTNIENPFTQPTEGYDAIEQHLLPLQSAPITMQLPDLRNVLNYYGKNSRPDADPSNALMYFGFTGDKTPTSIIPGARTYIVYDRNVVPPHYTFSPENGETHLWIETGMQGNSPLVHVSLKDENGNIIQEPAAFAKFTLQEKPLLTLGSTNTWEIGKQRVDGTLLARQKARWFGVDLFLEKHGGPEYEFAAGKQRIDFGEGSETYSVFASKDTVLVWDGTRWKAATPGEETVGKPLMAVKKIDDKLMTFELWDPEGKSKVTLNLLKSNEAVIPQNITSAFHFVGAKTLSQFVFEINKQRMILSPQDWLLQVDKGWKKLTTSEEIDAYVDRITPGYLFIFDAVERQDDHQVLVGTLFNRARTVSQHVEIPLQQAVSSSTAKNEGNNKPKEIPVNKPFESAQGMQREIRSNGNE